MRVHLTALCGALLVTACSVHPVTFTPDNGDPNGGPTTATLTVSRGGAAPGSVSAPGLALACGDTCTATVSVGATVTLVASPDPGAVFGGWSGGGCAGTDTTCHVTVTGDLAITARFDVAMFTVDVGLVGGGSGVVMSTGATLVCPGTCTASVAYNTAVTLVAAPAATSTFLGWGGACSGTGGCAFTVTGDTAVTAAFAADNDLVVMRAGNGTGTVTSNPAGITCGTDCSESYAPGTMVTLTAAAASDATFMGWAGGGCTGTGTCQVTLDQAVLVTATFALQKHTLTVAKVGNGSGTVTSNPAGITCGTDCSEDYDAHTMVTLTVAAATDSVFTGWSGGGCSGTGTCMVTMDAAVTVSAGFALKQFLLTVSRTGAGSGTVTSSPAGITCGVDCTESYDAHTVVTLTAAAAADSVFTGWTGGGCAGTGTCVVTMDAAVTVSAGFALKQFLLTVSRTGNGSGTVTSSPAGITCGADCTELYDAHTVVTLTAAAAADSVFTGWSGGGCSGTGTCVVTMDAAVSVSAGFSLKQFLLTVSKPGNGNGSVTSSPAGITCGVDCTELYNAHTVVTLTAVAAADSVFTGWSGGGCAGTGTCVVTMDAAVTVSASFVLKQFLLTVNDTGTGTGTVTSSPAGISCGADCTEIYDSGTVVTLTATPNAGSTFAGWSGACAGTGTCQVTMTAATSVTATFSLVNGLLAVSNFSGPPSIEIFPAGATGDVAPLRVISGSATTFSNPRGLAVVNNEIFVVEESGNAIDVFPVTASGNVAPVRQIIGSFTGLASPLGILVFNGEIYVAQTGGSIAVFPLGATGNVAPSRMITGLGGVIYLAISNGEIYVTNYNGPRILVFPVNASGAVTPTRIIGGAATGLVEPDGIVVSNGEIFVSDLSANQIRVFSQMANGNVAPLRVIGGGNTQLSFPEQLAIVAGELYVASFSTRSVVVFPVNANGDVVPTRRIAGPSTQLTGPLGAFVF